jgi:hypothetical protein
MEVKMPNYRNAKRNDILRHNGKEFIPFPIESILQPLVEKIAFLEAELEKTKIEQKQKITDILMIIKELNK